MNEREHIVSAAALNETRVGMYKKRAHTLQKGENWCFDQKFANVPVRVSMDLSL